MRKKQTETETEADRQTENESFKQVFQDFQTKYFNG